jgi:hypothetical protein
MESGYDDPPSDQGSGAVDQLAPGSPGSLNRYGSSVASSSVAGDGDDYDSSELQLVWDTVVRAQETLPYLPEGSRHPTNALFLAYDELLEEREMEPVDGQKLDKLLFKIGGSRSGDTIAEKFQAVMARMNFTVHFDANDADIGDFTDDGFSSLSEHFDSVDEREPPELLADEYTLERAGRERAYDSPDTPGPGQLPGRSIMDKGGQENDADYHQSELVLEKSVLGFERHQSKIRSMRLLEKWQDRSSMISERLKLYLAARAADFQVDFRDVVIAWNEIAVEVDEAPLDSLPANVYSKRIESIAIRTHEILATKRALARWQQCARERRRSQEAPPEQDLEVHFQDDPRLSRLATRAHENLVKSRVFTRWFNRASEEENKARIAAMAHEMGLKSKAFGVRPKLEVLEQALRQRLQAKASQVLEEPVQQEPELKQPTAPPTKSNPPEAQPTAVLQGESSPPPAAEPQPESTPLPQAQPETVQKPPTKAYKDELIADERAQLARRHILRMRVFRAWEEYTQKHTAMVKDRMLHKTIDPWRERSSQLAENVSDFSEKHDDNLVRDALHSWGDSIVKLSALSTAAEEARHSNRVRNALKPWMAAARRRHRSLQAQRRVIAHWHRMLEQHGDIETIALSFHRERSLKSLLSRWRSAVNDIDPEDHRLRSMAERVHYFSNTYGTLQEWKAQSRENAIRVSMKRDALKLWRDSHKRGNAQESQLQFLAERVNLYHVSVEILPAWRDSTVETVEREELLQELGERANFESLTGDALRTWRASAKQKRKARFKDAHLEVRRLVKRGMGARCVAQWRNQLHLSIARHEEMGSILEEAMRYRDFDATAQAFDMWRSRAQDRAEMDAMGDIVVQQKALDSWRERGAESRQRHAEAEEYRETRAASKALKDWKLSSLQMESRRNTVGKHLNKGRKLLKQGFEGWRARAADKPVPSRLPNASHRSVDTVVEAPQTEARETQAKGLLTAWRTAARGQRPQEPHEQAEEEDMIYAPTPSRPRLLLGSLGRGETTTPLAPIPQRQPWPSAGGPGDSILGRSAPGGTASRYSRSRRNLRVSWAE